MKTKVTYIVVETANRKVCFTGSHEQALVYASAVHGRIIRGERDELRLQGIAVESLPMVGPL